MQKYAAATFPVPNKDNTQKADPWCSYYGDWVRVTVGEYGYKRCPMCTISIDDFYFINDISPGYDSVEWGKVQSDKYMTEMREV